ncbi:uncharacterized protein TRUGW13939_04817 [Talaromyces rugulosus]|uniref:Uncharacterized protein n=1 Tax=Talaromyces rugulosus TaxID=121627 RepID=A0A7H8QUQ3_TALRU|nr:uncharacterized protein TRUGW13939_04817 [Talaromyces rugulosus]QKX57699.1 hypothetical protein TRUGW13939_04817 [Talaromyces rugulosus]
MTEVIFKGVLWYTAPFWQLQIPQRHPEDTVKQFAPFVPRALGKFVDNLLAQGSLANSFTSSNQDSSWMHRLAIDSLAFVEYCRQLDLRSLINCLNLLSSEDGKLGRRSLVHRQQLARESFNFEPVCRVVFVAYQLVGLLEWTSRANLPYNLPDFTGNFH